MRFIAGLLVILCATASRAGSIERVDFDPASRLLNFEAQNASLQQVASALSNTLQVQVWMAPGVEKPVTVRVQQLPLDKALSRILRGTNYLLHYAGAKEGKPGVLTGISLLPVGEHNSEQLQLVSGKPEPGTEAHRQLQRQNHLAVKKRNEQRAAKRKQERKSREERRRAKHKDNSPGTGALEPEPAPGS